MAIAVGSMNRPSPTLTLQRFGFWFSVFRVPASQTLCTKGLGLPLSFTAHALLNAPAHGPTLDAHRPRPNAQRRRPNAQRSSPTAQRSMLIAHGSMLNAHRPRPAPRSSPKAQCSTLVAHGPLLMAHRLVPHAPPLDRLPVQGGDGCWVRRQSSVLSRQFLVRGRSLLSLRGANATTQSMRPSSDLTG